MKKTAMRVVSLIMGAMMMAFLLVSCSKKPYDYKLSDYIAVPGDLTAITVTHEEIISAMDVQIQKLRENNSKQVEVTDRAIASGDTVKLSISCYKTDEKKTALPDISDSDCTLVVGDGKYPADLEKSLIGKEIGKQYSVKVTLPSTFSANDLAGKQIFYDVEIKAIYTAVLPEYNIELIKKASSFESVEEYEKYLYERMKEEIIFDKLLAQSTVSASPIDEVQSYTTSFTKYYTERADELKLTLEQYVAKKFFINMTDFHLKADAYAKSLVKEEMLLYTLARRYKLELTDDEYTEGAQKYAKEYGLESVSKLEAKFGTVYVEQTVLMDKVLAYLSEQITVIGAPESEMTPAV